MEDRHCAELACSGITHEPTHLVTTLTRSAALPAFLQSRFPARNEAESRFGIIGPKGTPADIIRN
jgi:hypothetical protein